MKQVTAYQCEWCSRCFLKSGPAKNHERACKNNPTRKNCVTCKHSCIGIVGERLAERYGGAEIVTTHGPVCTIQDMGIHEKPYFIECDMDDGCHGHREELPNPGTCHHYKYKGFAGWGDRAP